MARESNAAKVNEWSERLGRFQRSDLTVRRFCQSEGVSQGSFYLWKRRLAKRSRATGQPKVVRPKFQAVEFSTVFAQPEERATTIRLAEGVEIELGSDLRIVDQVVGAIIKQLCELRSATPPQGVRAC